MLELAPFRRSNIRSATPRFTYTRPLACGSCARVRPCTLELSAGQTSEHAHIPTRFKCKHAIRVACEFAYTHTQTHTHMCLSGSSLANNISTPLTVNRARALSKSHTHAHSHTCDHARRNSRENKRMQCPTLRTVAAPKLVRHAKLVRPCIRACVCVWKR